MARRATENFPGGSLKSSSYILKSVYLNVVTVYLRYTSRGLFSVLTLVYPLFGYALYNFLRNVETDIGIPEYL